MSGTQTQLETAAQVDPALNKTAQVDPAAPQVDSEIEEDDFSDPVRARAEIKKLRAESAKHRTKYKSQEDEFTAMKDTLGKLKQAFGGEDEEVDPAEHFAMVQQQNELLQVELSINQLARENGLSSDQDDYFKFLLNKKFESLEEGDELTDEDLQGVIDSVRKVSGHQSRQSTGVSGGNPNPSSSSSNSVTAEQFVKMTLSEKSKIYTDNAALYTKLLNEAQEKRLL